MVTNLQTLLLYDAGFNATLKWLGKMSMSWAKTLQALALEQYGSHSDNAAIYQTLMCNSLTTLCSSHDVLHQYVPMMEGVL